ncbi:uncharacterized protein LOC110862042 [Folsomia candida]|uniref:Rhamnosyl O-methyltransferase n=1 Tax=Folsomia candida TaxID=158441 RepID=A0A226D0A4_FOLCA|nr:uncharacterized protein LOC110862042 [Folsomia candida]OXA38091.1 Rhamnosyl O-methyltransferase [Folsomia candida]
MEPSTTNESKDLVEGNFVDLHRLRGLGDDPVYYPPILEDRPRLWPLDKWSSAPRDLGYDNFATEHWKGLRLLKDPETQSVYHNILWEIKPKTIIELGVYSGGSLVWFRDLTKAFKFPSRLIGIDIDLSRCQIPEGEMDMISLHQADCNNPESFAFLKDNVEHPILFIDDAHCNTFNVIKYAVNNFLKVGDFVMIEDTMGMWGRYSPKHLKSHLASFKDVMALDLLYSNVPCQLKDGVFQVIKSNN